MSEFDLFEGHDGDAAASAGGTDGPVAGAPLAARMRPRTLEDYVGQQHLLAPGRALRELIEKDAIGSIILWGPPGTGKTTIARIIAERTNAAFVEFSAVTEGVARVREIIREAEARRRAMQRRTILFCDEIHRFNKAQQDAFLPHVEKGTVALIGATTENPSFEVIGALLSRSRVFVLEPLSVDDVRTILQRALTDEERGLASWHIQVADDALTFLAEQADGDARRALNGLEAAAEMAGAGGTLTVEVAREAMQLRFARFDKSGEEFYNILSAYHKALRGSDPDGALYWMARWVDGGGDPLALFRRGIAMSAEDIGLADPQALRIAVAAREAFQVLGPPEGFLPLAEMTIYLATAPKSNSGYRGLNAALEAARRTPAAPVPMHIRNAPTRLMKDLGYHQGYRYAHDSPDHYLPQEYLPDEVRGETFYEPGPFAYEREIAKRLSWWARLKGESGDAANEGHDPAEDTGGG